MDKPVTFGEWIRLKRRILDLTQADLADRVGCSLSAIRKIESGDRRPSRQVVDLLATALDVPAEDRALFTHIARGERSIQQLPTQAAVVPNRSNLPPTLTPLVGREPEISQTVHLLRGLQCRWLTLVGPGGIGKTRVAIQAASRLQQSGMFRDGIYFVTLTGLDTTDLLVSAIAGALGFVFFGSEPPSTQISHYLREKRVLLLLDNLERLVDAANLLADLLSAAPNVKLLITSQERLRVQAEWVLEIHSLPLPESDQSTTPAALLHFSAVELFTQTAQRADPSFTLDSENMADVVRICRAVDGLPLGIELAASWVRALTCAEIAAEIQRGFDFLSGSDRSLPERHKSLRAVFEYSWRLLTAEERTALAKLSLLQGIIRRDAALAVAGASLPLLSALVDKSLLRHLPGGYNLHEVVRQFAALRLAENPVDEADAIQRHSDHFLDLLARSENDLMSARVRQAMDILNAALDNIRRAWEWAAAHNRVQPLLRATTALYALMEMRGTYLDGLRLFSSAGEMLGGWHPTDSTADAQRSLLLGRLFAKEAYFNMRLGRQGQAEPLFHLSISRLRPLAASGSSEAREALADALVMLATAEWHMGQFETARGLAREAYDIASALFSRWTAAYALLILALVEHSQGHTAGAYQIVLESMAGWRKVTDLRGLTLGLSYAAIIANDAGKPDEARAMLRECLEVSRSIDDRWGIATALNHLGQITFAQGEAQRFEAIQMLRESVALYREMGEPWNMGRALIRLGEAHHQQGDDDAAAQVLLEVVRIGWESPVTPLALDAMLRLAVILADRGALACALRVLAPVRAHPLCYEETRERANALFAAWQTQSGLPHPPEPEEFDRIVEKILGWSENFPRGDPCSQP